MLVLTSEESARNPNYRQFAVSSDDMNEPDRNSFGENLRRKHALVRGIKLNDALSRRFDNGTGDCGAEGTCATGVVSVSKGMDPTNPWTDEQQIHFTKKADVAHGLQNSDRVRNAGREK
jgi:ferredoxin